MIKATYSNRVSRRGEKELQESIVSLIKKKSILSKKATRKIEVTFSIHYKRRKA
jgi:hypothetical protein